MSTSNLDTNPIVVDHDTRKLTILYGSLGTLIAFASMVFAALTWWISGRRRLAAQHSSTLEHELESNLSGGSLGRQAHIASPTSSFAGVSPSSHNSTLSSAAAIDPFRQSRSDDAAATPTKPSQVHEDTEAGVHSSQTTSSVACPVAQASAAVAPTE